LDARDPSAKVNSRRNPRTDIARQLQALVTGGLGFARIERRRRRVRRKNARSRLAVAARSGELALTLTVAGFDTRRPLQSAATSKAAD
jgi:hypothetical protein